MVPVTAAPFDGAVMTTVGEVVSLLTVTATVDEDADAPVASRATAVRKCVPFAADAVFHETV